MKKPIVMKKFIGNSFSTCLWFNGTSRAQLIHG
jgi:hypothetical protein